jgi:hypothetical protein
MRASGRNSWQLSLPASHVLDLACDERRQEQQQHSNAICVAICVALPAKGWPV